MDFLLQIITPTGIYFDDKVTSLTLKLTTGYQTFLAGHIDLIGSLAHAPMHIVKNKETIYYAIHGGAVNVTKEKIVIITNAIENEKEIDEERANAAKKRAEERIKSKDPNIDLKRAQLSLERALARIQTINR